MVRGWADASLCIGDRKLGVHSLLPPESLNKLFLGQTPVLCIATNAGVEGAIVVGKLLEQDNLDIGYDAAKGRLPSQLTS